MAVAMTKKYESMYIAKTTVDVGQYEPFSHPNAKLMTMIDSLHITKGNLRHDLTARNR